MSTDLMMTGDGTIDLGAVLLGQLPQQHIPAVVAFVLQNGYDSQALALEAHQAHLGGKPALDFLPPGLGAPDVLRLLMGAQAIMRDALTATWDGDKYAELLTRTASIGPERAKKLGNNIAMDDTEEVGNFANFLEYLPNVGFTSLDSVAHDTISTVMNMLARSVPRAVISGKGNTLFEIYRLGEAILQLRKEAIISAAGQAFAHSRAQPPLDGEGKPDISKLATIAQAVMPLAIRTIGSKVLSAAPKLLPVAASAMFGPAVGSGVAGVMAAAPAIAGLLGAGDLQEPEIEAGDATDEAIRAACKSLREYGASFRTADRDAGQRHWAHFRNLCEQIRHLDPEVGDLFDDVLTVASVAAPVVGGVLGGPGGAAIGGQIGQVAGAVKAARHKGGSPSPLPSNTGQFLAPPTQSSHSDASFFAAIDRLRAKDAEVEHRLDRADSAIADLQKQYGQHADAIKAAAEARKNLARSVARMRGPTSAAVRRLGIIPSLISPTAQRDAMHASRFTAEQDANQPAMIVDAFLSELGVDQ